MEEADVAVLVLETEKKPPEDVVMQIAEKCKVTPENLSLIMFSTTSLAGATQVSGRIVETGLHKLERLGLDPLIVKHAWGYAPIVPVHPSSGEAMGRTNDAILYGGVTNYTLSYEDERELESIVKSAPSSSSKMLQEAQELAKKNPRFLDIFKEAGFDFYKIDPNIFAPALFMKAILSSWFTTIMSGLSSTRERYVPSLSLSAFWVLLRSVTSRINVKTIPPLDGK